MSGNIDYVSHIDTTGRADWWIDDQLRDEGGYLTDLITGHAVRFIGESKARPFLLYLAHHAPHYPFQGPPDPAERTVGGEFDPVGARADKREAYREMVQSMDHGIGQVVAALEKHGIRERTLIWFFSDNGAASRWGSNAPLRGSKGTDWEGRSPGFRPSLPGRAQIGAGAVTPALTSTLDVMPTILKFADVPANAEKPLRWHRSVAPVARRRAPATKATLLGRRRRPSGTAQRSATARGSSSSTATRETPPSDPCCSISMQISESPMTSRPSTTTAPSRCSRPLLRWRDDVASQRDIAIARGSL